MVQAGCYGRAFCPVGSYPRKRILQICQSLRILNALRASNVGVPLTLPQLEALTPSVLVSRLINARRHLLALRIAEMLNMDTDKVGPLSTQKGSCSTIARLSSCSFGRWEACRWPGHSDGSCCAALHSWYGQTQSPIQGSMGHKQCPCNVCTLPR